MMHSPIPVTKNKNENCIFIPVRFLNNKAVNEKAVMTKVNVANTGNTYLPTWFPIFVIVCSLEKALTKYSITNRPIITREYADEKV